MRKGFTLIELLIVVAIIAILAAIAVPNFLEAQVRSKVSRLHADMRSISTALESYSIDYGHYPLGERMHNKYADLVGWPNTVEISAWFGYMLLTTPVAYLNTAPKDPFIEKNAGATGADARQGYPPRFETIGTNLWGAVGTEDYQFAPDALDYGYRWALYSYGPARERRGTRIDYILIHFADNTQYADKDNKDGVYDATNGTVSFGYIFRTNKGVFGK